jgi:hypothetical protein
MNRHRKALFALGTLQLLAAGVLFMSWFAGNIKGVESRLGGTMSQIEHRLNLAGVTLPDGGPPSGLDAYDLLHEPIAEHVWEAESGAIAPIATLAALGAIILIAGVLPERRLHRPHDSDEPLA